ncbi:hypothetical protein CH380_05650 [Leptospira adleri]|uniref:Uncharacterized protein n=1 Tax=Leptospira adleri TaxID=2023186 RepID=A0A2M9YR50_9LEPT|nr:hypothetical protein CH380_05650 [Leptospira adleri]PJZ63330.1 hypothetical protein CH376_03575 [Leptospira adleri]
MNQNPSKKQNVRRIEPEYFCKFIPRNKPTIEKIIGQIGAYKSPYLQKKPIEKFVPNPAFFKVGISSAQ